MSGFSNTDTAQGADPYKERNLDDASLKDKVTMLTKFMENTKFCLLTTQTPDGNLVTRAMALAATEGNGVDVLFHSNSESGKTDDIKDGSNQVNLGFINSSGEWASISGKASIITDRDAVKKYYSPALKAWVGDLGDGKHDGGPEDPRIVLLKIETQTAQYALSKKTAVGSFIELAKGIATGEAPSVNKLRHLSQQEVSQWRSTGA